MLAAKAAGIRELILPAENAVNVKEDLKTEQVSEIQFHYVKTIDEVIELALEPAPAAARKETPVGA